MGFSYNSYIPSGANKLCYLWRYIHSIALPMALPCIHSKNVRCNIITSSGTLNPPALSETMSVHDLLSSRSEVHRKFHFKVRCICKMQCLTFWNGIPVHFTPGWQQVMNWHGFSWWIGGFHIVSRKCGKNGRLLRGPWTLYLWVLSMTRVWR